MSNGKKLLASALLTKNVVVDEDATFQELYDAILSIRQETVIGVDKIPGIVEYEYHHHTGSPESGGGCYTQPSYHQHTGSCYKTCEYWESGCRDVVDTNDDQVKCTYMVKHSVCTNGQEQERSRWHANDGEHHVNSDSSGTHLVVVCGKNEGTFEGYAPTCGLSEGQITGAHIVYDADAVSEAAMTYQKEADQNGISMEELEKMLDSLRTENEEYASYPETDTEEEPETEVESETEEETGNNEELETESESETESPAESEMESTSQTETESEVQTMPETGAGTEEASSETNMETESEIESETELESADEEKTEKESMEEPEGATETEPAIGPEETTATVMEAENEEPESEDSLENVSEASETQSVEKAEKSDSEKIALRAAKK